MRVVELPAKLLPGMHLFPPLMATRLIAAEGGIDLGLPQAGIVPLAHLTALAVRITQHEMAEIPILLLFVGGQRRPFSVFATKVQGSDFGLSGSPHRPPHLRELLLALAREAPHLVVDDATLEFMEGRMLRPIGDKLGDLADAMGLALVNKEPLRDASLPGLEPATSAPAAARAPTPAPALAPAPRVWANPAVGLLLAFHGSSIFAAQIEAAKIDAWARHLDTGVDPRQALGKAAREVPNAAVTGVRRRREPGAVELELRSRDGTSTWSVPYADEEAGDALIAALRHHLNVQQ